MEVSHEQVHTITKNVSLYINDANNISDKLKNIDFI